MRRHFEQAALAAVHDGRNALNRVRQQLAVADDAQPAGTFRDQGVAAGKKRDRPRLDERVYVGHDPVVVIRRAGSGLAGKLNSAKKDQGRNRECSSHRYTIIRAPWLIAVHIRTSPSPIFRLTDQVFINAASKPESIAMACGLTGRTITYGELFDRIRRTAAGLAARGIKKGDVVSLWSPNVPEWPIVFFARDQARRDCPHLEPGQHAGRARLPARRRRRQDAVHGLGARRQGEGGDRGVDRADRAHSRSTRRRACRRSRRSRSTRIRRPCRSIRPTTSSCCRIRPARRACRRA